METRRVATRQATITQAAAASFSSGTPAWLEAATTTATLIPAVATQTTTTIHKNSIDII